MGAILSNDRRISSRQFNQRVLRAMTGLARLGVGEGDAVIVLMRNDTVFLEASSAIGRLGASPVPANWHARPDEIGAMVRSSGARFAVVDEDLATSHGAGLPEHLVIVRKAVAEGAAASAMLDWEALVRDNEPFAGTLLTARGALIYTSGTTGTPKAIERERFTPAQERGMTELLRRTYGFRSGMRALLAGPLYHSMSSSYARTAMASMGEDGLLVIESRFDAERLLRVIEELRITHLLMVPVMFVRLLKLDPSVRERFDTSSIECVTHSAAPCSAAVKRAMIDWWGPVIVEFYAGSETGPLTMVSSSEYLERPGSVGQPVPGSVVHIFDDAGHPLPAGQSGEIAGRNSFFPDFTYANQPREREKLRRGDLIATGDIGYVDADGYLFLQDRKKDMVITGGVNVFPAEIEALLLALPEVRDCAVFGIPDDEFGESLAAHIERSAGSNISAEEVQAYLRSRMAGYKVPKIIRFEESLPREDNGKIYKRRLADAYWQGTGRRI